MARNYGKIFALIASINKIPGVYLEYGQLVSDFTNGRTSSLRKMSDQEIAALEEKLEGMAPKSDGVNFYKLDGTRKAIISQFKSIGKTAKDAISWAEKYGVNGQKKKFNDYSGQELFKLLQNAKKVKSDYLKSVSKSVRDGI